MSDAVIITILIVGMIGFICSLSLVLDHRRKMKQIDKGTFFDNLFNPNNGGESK